jgi:hypothetical protein
MYVITWTRASGRDSNITRSTPKGHDIFSRVSLSASWTQRAVIRINKIETVRLLEQYHKTNFIMGGSLTSVLFKMWPIGSSMSASLRTDFTRLEIWKHTNQGQIKTLWFNEKTS